MMLVKQAVNPHINLHVIMTGETVTLVESLWLVLVRTSCTIKIKLSCRINLYNIGMFFFCQEKKLLCIPIITALPRFSQIRRNNIHVILEQT